MNDLRIRVLGPLEVDGVDVRALGSRKARTMLTVLAAAGGRVVPLDVLADVLWGEEQPSNPADQLSVLASRLRRALGRERVVRLDAGYAVAADWIDGVELRARIDEASTRLAAGNAGAAMIAASAAVDLVRGPLAADRDSAWFDAERSAVARDVARARVLLAQAALAAREPERAVVAAEGALDHDPYDEVALRLLMRAHVDSGRPASALAAYARMRERLRDDLGVDPGDDTESLHGAVLRGDVERTARREVAAPPGRAEAMAVLDRTLGKAGGGAPQAVVVEGEAGIGKSTLVRAFASAARAGGAVVVEGRCDELGRDLPLQPILDAFDGHGGRHLAVEAPAGATTLPDVEAGRLVLFRALLDIATELAETAPLVVIVEDIHLAGATTLEWLQLALRRPIRLLVVATRRPEGPADLAVADAERLVLGPLDLDAARLIAGEERAAELLARSGGHPLFLTALARADDDALPASIRDAVESRAASLGDETAAALVAAAVLGPAVDLDLLAGVVRRPAGELLDALERAARAGLLDDGGRGLRFPHELVREALAASATAARTELLHRQAAVALRSRAGADPAVVAWHARLGGDDGLAARSLVDAAALAAARFDTGEAERLLTEAIALADSAPARMARARVRMTLWEMDAARADATCAIELGGGVAALELAGWVAYYQRDHDGARRYADEAVARATDPALRASALSLAARSRHSRGELAAAAERLEEAVTIAVGPVRAVPQIWLAAVRLHQGDPAAAADLAERGLVDPGAVWHPFAPLHARFARAMALGIMGRPLDALAEVDRLESAASDGGPTGARFWAVAANVRGWVLRSIGRPAEGDELNASAADLTPGPSHDEPRYVGHLDLVDGALAAGDLDRAEAVLVRSADIEQFDGTMAWRQRGRHRLARARLALAHGEAAAAVELASDVATAAASAGSPRYTVLGRLHAARATIAMGEKPELDAVAADLDRLDGLAGLEAWWVTAEVAASLGVDRWWADAERRAEALARRCGPHEAGFRAAVADRLTRLRR